MEKIVSFPDRFLHPLHSVLAREILRLWRQGLARKVEEFARLTGANPILIDRLLDQAVAMRDGGSAA